MRTELWWVENGNGFPVNKVECTTDGNVRLVTIENKGKPEIRDVWKVEGSLEIKYFPAQGVPANK